MNTEDCFRPVQDVAALFKIMKGIILFNPKAANHGFRIPNSILQVAASIEGKYKYTFVDGNRESNPWLRIKSLLDSGEYGCFGCTVMPGPQLKQAVPFSLNIRQLYPETTIIWGGYFASNQYKTVLNSGCIDFIIDGPGDHAFPMLLDAINGGGQFDIIPNLIFKREEEIVKTKKATLFEMDTLPVLPYQNLFDIYSAEGYLKRTFLGNHTAAYHSSFGCPFTCSFCAVVPIYNARWKGFSANRIYNDLIYLKKNFNIDAVEFHDNNFFVNEKRTVEFANLIENQGIQWWGEGRIDTLDKYEDRSLELIRKAGCRMIFFGAETGNDTILKQMDKGGTQTAEQIERFAARMRKFDIIPEYSFVLGMPAETEEKVMENIENEISFIKKIKEVNPDTEIIIYIYSPVPTEGSELYESVIKTGFSFPKKLEDWLDPQWQNFDLRKNPLTPWLKPYMIDRINSFETVLNAYSPSISDFKLTEFQKKTMNKIAGFRYRNELYKFPLELKLLQKYWLKYRQPELEGMYTE